MTPLRRWLLVALIVVLFVAAAGFLYWLFDGVASIDAIKTRVANLGAWAPAGFIALYGIATIALIPGGAFDVVGGALFGVVYGSMINLAGATIGAIAAFLIARYVAADWVQQRAGPRVQKVIRSVEQDGWQFVAFIRMVPVFPYAIANYLLGLTRIPFHHYLLATVVFMLPSTVAYTYIGYAGGQAIAGDTYAIRYALAALAVIACLIMAPRFYKRWRGNGEVKPNSAD